MIDMVKLRERIAVSAEFSPEERALLLSAISSEMEATEIVSHDPGNRNHTTIDAVYAWLSVDDGGEGICAAPMVVGGHVMTAPLVAGSARTAHMLRPFAQTVSAGSNKIVRLVKFSRREILEWHRP